MSNLPDWLEIVDSYDKATPWPGSHDLRMTVFPNGHLSNDTEETMLPGSRRWVRVRTYREGVEAAINAIQTCDLSEVHRKDGVQVLNDAAAAARGLIAPPAPPLKFGDWFEAHDESGAWVDSIVVAVDRNTLIGVMRGSVLIDRYRCTDEGKTWRRKS